MKHTKEKYKHKNKHTEIYIRRDIYRKIYIGEYT